METSISTEPIGLKVTAGYGRLYVTGPSFKLAQFLPGAVLNEGAGAFELSLTLETLQRLRKATGLSYPAFKRLCTPEVIAWAERTAAANERVAEAQRTIAAGWRPEGMLWQDLRAGMPAPRTAKREHVDEAGLWKYREPYDHQQIMVAAGMLLPDGSANLSQMGTGKTRALCELAAHWIDDVGELDLAIVVCPKGAIGTWLREGPNWSQSLHFEGLHVIPRMKKERTVKERKARLLEIGAIHASPKAIPKKPNVVLVNYDVLHQLLPELQQLCRKLNVGIFPDEMHKLSNPQAKVTKAMLKLAPLAKRRLGMTGTPITDRTATGIWSQWYFVDLGQTFGANAVQYRHEFLIENPWTHETIPKPGALETIGQRIARRSVRFLKKDCMDLPEKVYDTKYVDLTDSQAKAYQQMASELLADLASDESEAIASAATQLTSILRLSQITSGFLPLENGELHRFTPNPKLDALKEIIEGAIDLEQIVVWAHYRHDHDLLMKTFAPHNPVLIRGGMKGWQQDEAERKFQTGETRLLIAQQQAGGESRNLQMGSLVVYYSQWYSIVYREQSEDRTHRGGSDIHDRIMYINLVCNDTVDEDVIVGLQEKRTAGEIVVDLKRRLRGY